MTTVRAKTAPVVRARMRWSYSKSTRQYCEQQALKSTI
jgi:hypothetical protein